MMTFTYNDTLYQVQQNGDGWDIVHHLAEGVPALVATGVFAGLAQADAFLRAQDLVHAIEPVGVRIVGPDITHPITVGDLHLVGPDLGHATFVCWDQASSSFLRER